MDWLKIFMLACCVIMAISTPPLLAKAIRRREKARIFDILASDAFFIVIAAQTVWPEFTAHSPRLIRWLMIGVAMLLMLNGFGLSRWLVKARKAQAKGESL